MGPAPASPPVPPASGTARSSRHPHGPSSSAPLGSTIWSGPSAASEGPAACMPIPGRDGTPSWAGTFPSRPRFHAVTPAERAAPRPDRSRRRPPWPAPSPAPLRARGRFSAGSRSGRPVTRRSSLAPAIGRWTRRLAHLRHDGLERSLRWSSVRVAVPRSPPRAAAPPSSPQAAAPPSSPGALLHRRRLRLLLRPGLLGRRLRGPVSLARVGLSVRLRRVRGRPLPGRLRWLTVSLRRHRRLTVRLRRQRRLTVGLWRHRRLGVDLRRVERGLIARHCGRAGSAGQSGRARRGAGRGAAGRRLPVGALRGGP